MSGGGAETVVEGHEKDEEEQGSGGSQWSAGVAQILTACTHLHIYEQKHHKIYDTM